MKRTIALTAAILVTLSACSLPASNPNARNGNGSLAVGTLGDPIPTAPPTATRAPILDDLTAVDSVDGVIEIREKLFVAQINDIYSTLEDYLGKTLKYEGIFTSYTWDETGETYRSVIRYGPGCCGTDGNAGFEVTWDGAYPSENDWVECVGTLEMYNEGNYSFLRLDLDSLTVLDVRGAEYVTQ
ncbi:MAG: hypothetical protein LBC65_04970 [Oscillospiraceae bacterium]|jgi:hypothetical protein|nr:hypothetical protein [Oscillospiraceae bacterium]